MSHISFNQIGVRASFDADQRSAKPSITFADPSYAKASLVLLDIEDPQSYQFNGKLYSNTSELKYHQLAYLFTQQNEEPITPTFAIFNKRLQYLFSISTINRRSWKI